jgi:hypothetical protein
VNQSGPFGWSRPPGSGVVGSSEPPMSHVRGIRTDTMSTFANSSHMPCSECGASVPTEKRSEHTCDPERRLDFLMFQLHEEVAGFEQSLREYLTSPQGRFAQWLAEVKRPPLANL